MSARSRTMNLALLPAWLALVAAGPVLAQEPFSPTLSLDGFPPWLVDSMARETRRPGSDKVNLPIRHFETRLAGRNVSEPQELEIGYYVTADIKAQAPLECWVVTAAIDPAAMTRNLASLSMDQLSQTFGALQQTIAYYIDAGVIGDYPYLAYESLYSMGEAPETRIGFIKVRIASKDDVHFVCAHNEIGYRETFARAFESFVREASFDAEDTETYRRDISRMSIGGQATGYMINSYGVDAEGDTVTRIQTASLAAFDGSSVTAEDSYDIGFWTPSGELISRRVVSAADGELAMNLNIVNQGDDLYAVTGTFQGKAIEHVIESAVAPMSPLEQTFEVQRMLADPARGPLVARIWEPSVDPTAFIEASFEFDPERRDERIGKTVAGPLEMITQVDEDGMAVNGSMDLGPMSLDVQRLIAIGEVPFVAAID